MPSAFIFRKAGDSLSFTRIHTEIASSTIENRKGRRQPHSPNAFSPSVLRSVRMIPSDSSRPSDAVTWIHEVQDPRLPCGACSATYVTAPPYSPPSARPWIIRTTTKMIGAAMPIDA